MKMRRFSGWKTRVQTVLLAALCGVAAIVSAPSFAPDPATPATPVETAAPAADAPLVAPEAATADTTPAPAEAVATDAAVPVEAAPAEAAAAAEEAPAPSISGTVPREKSSIESAPVSAEPVANA